MATLIFSKSKIKKPYQSKENILTIHSPKSYSIEIANTLSIDTGITINLPKKSTAHLPTEFKGQKIKEIKGPKKQRLWLTLLNKSYFEKHKINKGDIIGSLLITPSNLKIKYEKKPLVKTRKLPNNSLPKEWSKNWKTYWTKKKGGKPADFTVGKILRSLEETQ